MICPYCGRRNPAGATFCSRCRQRLPVAGRVPSNKRLIFAEPAGGGGVGALAIGAALLAGFVFIGGAAALYLSSPPGNPTLPPNFGGTQTPGPTLDIFVQPTPTPSPSPQPTPSPTFFLNSPTPTASFEPSPSPTPFGPTPSPKPTRTPRPPCDANGLPPGCKPTPPPATPTPEPTPAGPVAKFSWDQVGTSFTVSFTDTSTGGPTSWAWDFAGLGTSDLQTPPSFEFPAYDRDYTVTLTVTNANGTSTKPKTVTLQAPLCTGTDDPPGCIPTPPPPAPAL